LYCLRPKQKSPPSASAHPLSHPHRHAVPRPPYPRHLVPDPRDLSRTRAGLEQGPPHSRPRSRTRVRRTRSRARTRARARV
ncbi:hypothetical protein FB451DRAFT_1550717, partial [Mycena latifolia]